jgi:hypothetical protein
LENFYFLIENPSNRCYYTNIFGKYFCDVR